MFLILRTVKFCLFLFPPNPHHGTSLLFYDVKFNALAFVFCLLCHPSQLLCSLWSFCFPWSFSSEISHSQASIRVCEWKARLASTGSDGTFLCVDICLYRSSGVGLSPTWVCGPGTVWVRLADREQKCRLLTCRHCRRKMTFLWMWKASVTEILIYEMPKILQIVYQKEED